MLIATLLLAVIVVTLVLVVLWLNSDNMGESIAGMFFIGAWVIAALASAGIPLVMIYVIFHFASKHW